MRRSLAACTSAAAFAAAMTVALLAGDQARAPAPAAADELPSAFRGPGAVADDARDPATTPFSQLGGPETLVLLGGGVDYALLSADGRGEVGRGDVFWRQRGRLDCSPSATPFGSSGTDLRITIVSAFPVAGTANGTMGAPSPGCDRASGSWSGTGGDLLGRDGTLVVSRDADGLVRVALGP